MLNGRLRDLVTRDQTRQVGLEPTENRGWQDQEAGTTQKKTQTDDELAVVLRAWPSMTPAARSAVLAVIRAVEVARETV